jgi:hypothetical protein
MKWRHLKSLKLLLIITIAMLVVIGLVIAAMARDDAAQEHCPQTPGTKLPHGAEIGNCHGLRGYP